MNKKYVYAYIISSIIIILVLNISVNYIRNTLNENKNDIIFIDKFLPKQAHTESGKFGKYVFKKNIDIKDFQRIHSDTYHIILYGIDCYGYKVYFNNNLIGSKGSYTDDKVNIWNSIEKYEISKEYISESNEILIELYSDKEFIPVTFPIIITNNNLSNKIIGFIRTVFLDFYFAIIGMIIFSTILLTILYTSSEGIIDKRKYICFQIGTTLIIIYILEYISFSYLPISKLLLTKISMVSIYSGIAIMSTHFSKAYRMKSIMILSLINLGILLGCAVFSSDYTSFRNLYSYTDLLKLVILLLWMIGSFRNIKNSCQNIIIFIGTSLVVIFTIKDLYISLYGPSYIVSYTIYALLIFCLGIVDISLENYINSQNTVYTNTVICREQKENYKNLSITDPLTKLYNRRYLYVYLKRILNNQDIKFCILFCDLDHFKKINDTIGHKEGDLVLMEAAGIIKEIIASKGLAFRYGGEELVVVLDNMKVSQAYEVAEKIRMGISTSKDIKEVCLDLNVTVSIGISSYPIDATDGDNIELLIDRADKAMYHAKQMGRDRTEIYDSHIEF